MDSRSLRCPQCGAATATGAPRCQYCRARLATVSCPSCFALMFDDAEFCERCGTRRARLEAASVAKCPGCRTNMHSVAMGSTSLLECPACDGLWVDAQAFDRICSDHEAQAAVVHNTGYRAAHAEHRVSYRPCVGCGALMNRMNFGRISGTIVDVCKQHGTFLDAGELQAIVRFIQDGGLERARQRQIEDLRVQQSRLRMEADRLARIRRSDGHSADWHYEAGSAFGDLLWWLADD